MGFRATSGLSEGAWCTPSRGTLQAAPSHRSRTRARRCTPPLAITPASGAATRTPFPAIPPLAAMPAPLGSRLRPFNVDQHYVLRTPVKRPLAVTETLAATPTRLGSRLHPFNVDQHYVPRTPVKRPLAVIDISDDEEDLRPRKRPFHLGTVDLTD